jgi:hypothetical protein
VRVRRRKEKERKRELRERERTGEKSKVYYGEGGKVAKEQM